MGHRLKFDKSCKITHDVLIARCGFKDEDDGVKFIRVCFDRVYDDITFWKDIKGWKYNSGINDRNQNVVWYLRQSAYYDRIIKEFFKDYLKRTKII